VSAQVETVFRLAGVIPDLRGSTVPTVVWTHRGERRLQEHLIRAAGSPAGRAAAVADCDDRLAAAFPGATAVVVLDLYAGFRPQPDEFILRVDVRDPGRPGTCVVKLYPDDELRQELAAWTECQPSGFLGDAVFMALEARYRPAAPGRFAALVYQDAGPHIGADEVIPLETAVLRAVRFGSPEPGSVLAALDKLFAQLGRVLYTANRPEDPNGGGVTLNPDRGGPRRRLATALADWRTTDYAVDARKQVGAAFPKEFDGYLDPVDYAQFLEAEHAARPAARVLPRTLRGRAHGDLHGRNVLVGVEDNRADSPALFDYEHMSCDNLVGWDFVKLETELKVRAVAALHPTGRVAELAAAAEAFETRLAAATLAAHETKEWPPADPAGDGWDRLAAVVLAVRRHAAVHLGERPNRVHEWLREYHFLLMCYGLSTVGFGNPTPRERAAVLVSAGVAAVRYEQTRPGGSRDRPCGRPAGAPVPEPQGAAPGRPAVEPQRRPGRPRPGRATPGRAHCPRPVPDGPPPVVRAGVQPRPPPPPRRGRGAAGRGGPAVRRPARRGRVRPVGPAVQGPGPRPPRRRARPAARGHRPEARV